MRGEDGGTEENENFQVRARCPEGLMDNTRNISVDAAKLLAAFGVVMIHLAPSTPAAELLSRIFLSFAVPYFLTIALYFFIEKACRMERLKIVELNLDRILVPYAVWTIIYLAFRLIKYQVQHKPFSLDIVPEFFYGSSGVQMYFLPLLLLFQAQALALLLVLRKPPCKLTAIFILIGAGIFSYVGSQGDYLGFRASFEKGWIYILFVFLLRYSQSNPFGRRVNLFLGTIIAALTVAATAGDYDVRWLIYMGGPLAGYSIAALALNLRLPSAGAAWRFVLTCSYGIYLAHVLFLEIFEFAAARLGHEMAPYSVLAKVLMSLLICSCCILLIWFTRLNRISAYLLLGETTRRQPGTSPKSRH
jgi:peptidoglycan/LPS O-acetylase OafA/YrhL